MKITPLEIRQKTFEKVFRGYEKDEVNAYLQSLSMEWERLLDENKELYLKIETLETESTKLRELESSLFKTLKTAEDTGATLIEQAKKETDLQIKESTLKAEEILTEARNKAKNLVENAEDRKKQILEEMIGKVKSMESLFNQMTDLREKVVDQVKSYSGDLLERIEKLEKKSEDLQVKDIVKEAKQVYNSSSVGEPLDFLKESDAAKEENNAKAAPEKEESKKEESKKEASTKEVSEKEESKIEEPPEKLDTFNTAAEEKEAAVSDESPESQDESPLPTPKKVREDHKEVKSSSTSFFDEID